MSFRFDSSSIARALLPIGVVAGCSMGTAPSVPSAEWISIDPGYYDLLPAEQVRPSVNAWRKVCDFDSCRTYESPKPASPSWQSSNPSIADVIGGVVTARRAGQVQITVTSGSLKATLNLTIGTRVLPMRTVALNWSNACAIDEDGGRWCWGQSLFFFGPSPPFRYRPQRVSELERFQAIAGNGLDWCMILEDGSAGCRTAADRWPSTILPGRRIVSLALTPSRYALDGSPAHGCVVDVDGNAACWGSNSSGELGSGTDVLTSRDPLPVVGVVRWATITACGRHTCGLDDQGALYCWGENSDGQLGDGTTTRRATPVRIDSTERFQSVAPGDRHTCALSTVGRISCWGSNSAGELGLGALDAVAHPVPTPIAANVPFSMLAAGIHSCALDVSGVPWCWGLGRATPVALGEPGYLAIATGPVSACGVRADGRIACWGSADHLQLGSYGPSTSVPRPTAGPFLP